MGTTKYTEIQENASLMNTVSALKVTSTSRNSSDNKNEKNRINTDYAGFSI